MKKLGLALLVLSVLSLSAFAEQGTISGLPSDVSANDCVFVHNENGVAYAVVALKGTQLVVSYPDQKGSAEVSRIAIPLKTVSLIKVCRDTMYRGYIAFASGAIEGGGTALYAVRFAQGKGEVDKRLDSYGTVSSFDVLETGALGWGLLIAETEATRAVFLGAASLEATEAALCPSDASLVGTHATLFFAKSPDDPPTYEIRLVYAGLYAYQGSYYCRVVTLYPKQGPKVIDKLVGAIDTPSASGSVRLSVLPDGVRVFAIGGKCLYDLSLGQSGAIASEIRAILPTVGYSLLCFIPGTYDCLYLYNAVAGNEHIACFSYDPADMTAREVARGVMVDKLSDQRILSFGILLRAAGGSYRIALLGANAQVSAADLSLSLPQLSIVDARLVKLANGASECVALGSLSGGARAAYLVSHSGATLVDIKELAKSDATGLSVCAATQTGYGLVAQMATGLCILRFEGSALDETLSDCVEKLGIFGRRVYLSSASGSLGFDAL